MTVPMPTPIFRLLHIANLSVCLQHGALYAPNHILAGGLPYKTIHDTDVQRKRQKTRISCNPRATIHDYVSFYFGYLSPMLLRLKSGRVGGYNEGQEPLLYLISTAQAIAAADIKFVFSNGHGIAAFTSWYDDLSGLNKVDWDVVYQRYWKDDSDNDNDRQRRKQAEFLIYQKCDWALIQGIAVINQDMKPQVERIFSGFPKDKHRPVQIRPDWYY